MMLYTSQRRELWEVTRTLVNAAMGREKADLVIRGGRLVNVHTAEIQEGVDVAIKAGRVVLVGEVEHTIGEETQVMDATGYFLLPGLIEGHVHIESSMITPTQFARAVLPHGTTAVFIDNHELANVLGVEGVTLMMEEARSLPLKIYLAMPSCVPALSGFEDAGAVIGPAEIEEAMNWDCVPRRNGACKLSSPLASVPAMNPPARRMPWPNCGWGCMPCCVRALPGTI